MEPQGLGLPRQQSCGTLGQLQGPWCPWLDPAHVTFSRFPEPRQEDRMASGPLWVHAVLQAGLQWTHVLAGQAEAKRKVRPAPSLGTFGVTLGPSLWAAVLLVCRQHSNHSIWGEHSALEPLRRLV